MKDGIGLSCTWTIRERDRKSGLVIAERRAKNLWTNYGLTALAGAPGGNYVLPQYLVVENNYTTISNISGISAGATSVQVAARVDQTGDTQIVLSPGLASQETITFSSVTGSGPYTYNFSSGCVNAHAHSDPVCRMVNQNDTVTNVVGEQQYDATNFPNQRMQSPSGYSPGTAQYTIQFFYPGPSAQFYFMLIGLSDSITVGAGNLHSHVVMGYNHNSTTNDLEVDATITLSNT